MAEHSGPDLWQVLEEERDALLDTLTQAWIERHPVPLERTEVRAAFERWWGIVAPWLSGDVTTPAAAQASGVTLAGFPDAQPEDCSAVQQVLGDYVARHAAAHLADVMPRCVTLLAEMGAGFYKERGRRAARFNMDVMSHMGHDLKTPINSIVGFSKVILKGIDGPITELQEQDLQSIYEGGQNLLTMINDIFQTAKLDATKTGVWAEPYELTALVAEVWATAQTLVGREGLTFTIHSAGELGKISLDASRLRWVLLCLVYMAAGKRELGEVMVRVQQRQDGGQTRVCFTISGPGQPPQLSAPSLRLVMAQNFSAQLGGDLVIERHDEQGLLAKVCFPLH